VSMGQQQRVAVARAVIAAPAVVLADEPTSHQDPDHAAVVIAALLGCAAEGSAVLVASHDEQVARAASQIIELEL
jgi:ABC-type lipoprotein export system ATPase subunit